jgi:hypothetical protein
MNQVTKAIDSWRRAIVSSGESGRSQRRKRLTMVVIQGPAMGQSKGAGDRDDGGDRSGD